MSGRLHLPDVLYGGLDSVADQLDELGSDATIQELSCALVNIARATAANTRTLDKLNERVNAIDKHIDALLDIAKTSSDTHKIHGSTSQALEDLLTGRIDGLRERIDSIERSLERSHRTFGPP